MTKKKAATTTKDVHMYKVFYRNITFFSFHIFHDKDHTLFRDRLCKSYKKQLHRHKHTWVCNYTHMIINVLAKGLLDIYIRLWKYTIFSVTIIY